jgi:hypothetical protein
MDGQARVAEWVEPVTTDDKIRVRLVSGALCRSEYHELIEDPDEVTQREDGDDDPEHD